MEQRQAIQVEFCGKKGCRCPIIETREDGRFDIGGKEEGVTVWTKDHLRDFVDAAKKGEFDNLVK